MSLTPRNERIIWIIIYIFIVTVSFLAIWQLKSELIQTQKDILIAEQKTKTPDITPSIDTPAIPDDGNTFTDNDSAMFTSITGTLLKADLLSHPELIPYSGVLGGTMNFYNEDMTVIGDKWVMAYFEDGHIWWYALYTYTGDENNISWILLDSYIL